MTKKHGLQIGHLFFNYDKPTEHTFIELYSWVIWQFPRANGQGLCGAVRPPIQGYGWLPALIFPSQQQAVIHAHKPYSYETPEEAAATLYPSSPTS